MNRGNPLSWPAELAFAAHLARHTSHFVGERVVLLHHGVDNSRRVQELALRRITLQTYDVMFKNTQRSLGNAKKEARAAFAGDAGDVSAVQLSDAAANSDTSIRAVPTTDTVI